ncbi:MAG: type II secretion system F family protein [Paracoccaceae bacterium]|jgi:tight adherence protein B|uniref:type II secretion system F family protein n=1 Tax=unclassified Seohaeicola TaxID=2641111 RepID=UPI00237C10E5|nr:MULTISPECIES: type II secretion system F family protein [unclassified Seohaeicola]MDD9709363.1 type II secretion system F family protein [Seohaeicola sp. 4SK31]MDD9737610.1 type II secretion system F family protein [Seohaeicola sp. SP36]MDF1707205.1 type II secretion system F family protein [Paracoccaceae bacterium]MDM7970286.1 type II secretion system F family protein [Paracoccaceae bacterium]
MSIIVIYGFIFGAVLLLTEAMLRRLFGARSANREVNERLERLKAGSDQLSTYKSLLSDRGVGRSGLLSLGWLSQLYRQSGLMLSLPRRVLYTLVILLGAWIGAAWLTNDLLIQIILALTIGPSVILALVIRVRARRIAKFVAQLPDALDIIVRSMNSGHPLTTAIALVGREMPDPIGSEFGILSDQLTFGSELDDAMLRMVDRVGADELNLLAVTVSVQRSTGGNLSEILENLSGMIRDRAMLRNKIRAISAEGRITAIIMAAFPFLLYLMISTLVPTYFDPVWESGYGTTVVVSILVLMSFGLLILYKLVKFDF